jgi:hypothetical protein
MGLLMRVDDEMNKQQRQEQLLLLKHELSIPQILSVYGKQFKQIKKRYSDEHDGRCAVGVIMSYYGWSGMHDSNAPSSLQMALHKLEDVGIRSGTVIKLNDCGKTFDEIADYIDLVHLIDN